MVKKNRQRKKIKTKIFGTKECPRLSVFRSNKHIYAQLIDDQNGNTLLSCSDLKLKNLNESLDKTEVAKKVGMALAEKAKAKQIKKVIFDRNGYKFHGRVKALAEGARENGLIF